MRATVSRIAVGICSLLWAVLATGQAILTTPSSLPGSTDGSNEAIVFPSPNTGLPAPARSSVPLPSGARPHGVSCYGSDNALVADASNFRVFVVGISTASLLDTIPTPDYNGLGTIAVASNLGFALAAGPTTILSVIAAPFGAGSTITTVALPGTVGNAQTRAIAFDPSGRAFVYHTSGVSVLDPPYSSVAFTIPVSNAANGAVAISPDGNTLLLTNLSGTVQIFTAPFSPASVPVSLAIPGATNLNGIVVTPDGSTALVVASSSLSPALRAISAPFTSSSAVETIALGAVFGSQEDLDVSPDGQLAILAGDGFGIAATAFVRGPFTAAAATVFNVNVPGGRGAGSVRFLQPALAPGLTVAKSAPLTVSSGANLTYTIAYGNTGTALASGVVIRDPVPAGTTFVSATGGGTFGGGVVSWNIGTIAAGTTGQSVSFTVNVTAPSGTIDNSGYAIEGAGIPPVSGPAVSTSIAAAPTPTATPPGPGPATQVPTLSPAMLALLAAGLALVGLGALSRRA